MGNFKGSVLAVTIDDYHIITPAELLQGSGQITLFIIGDDDN
jgi:hypothetical protein